MTFSIRNFIKFENNRQILLDNSFKDKSSVRLFSGVLRMTAD